MDARVLRRREAIVALGLAGAGAAYALWKVGDGDGGQQSPRASALARSDQCVLQPELTEGPFYVDGALFRRDVREGKPGAPLELRLTVQDAESCEPIRGATVETWEADADGEYSAFNDPANTTYLRGQQRSDRRGLVEFLTIYPGWYVGRTPHIHVKVHVGGEVVHTGQLFFEDSLSARVYSRGAYAARGAQDTTNAEDGIYGGSASRSNLKVSRRRNRKGRKIDGYEGRLNLGVVRA